MVTRFAPSPTGHLHVGGARTALFSWALARRHGGRFMIRIEDTDQARSSEESARGILEDLAWLGLSWDDGPVLKGTAIGAGSRAVGPYFQAQRLAIYNAYIEHLVKMGRAYPAFETAHELETRRKAAVAAKQTYRYQRPSDVVAGVFNAARWARAQAGEAHVVRFVSPPGEVVVKDRVLGEVRIAPGELDDFVIRKADGFPTYHFAVVIDDELMGVTHVMRAQEHLINTPKHVALQAALTRLVDDRDAGKGSDGRAFRTPMYGHLPLICNPDGSKMSKRDKAKAARKFVKDQMGKDAGVTAASVAARSGLEEKLVADFVAGETDAVEVAVAIAKAYGLSLPEIDVWDYRASGYLPEVVMNYLALLGWSTGQKNADGTDLDRFGLGFIAEHFSVERIGKKEARFDRAKLLAFNADVLAKLDDEKFLATWLAWLAVYEPGVHRALGADPLGPTPFAFQQLVWLVQAVKPRAKTLADAHRSIGFALVGDDQVVFDQGAVAKALRGPAAPASKDAPATGLTGLDVLGLLRTALAELVPGGWTPADLDAAIAGLASAKGVGLGAAAQPLRVALTGGLVSPGLGHCCAILGRERTLARIDRCVAQV
jgi:glutamyl-tRNA synthetase